MPNYDFECTSCKKMFESYSSMEDIHRVKCECGGTTQVLIGSRPNVHIFKSFESDGLDPERNVLITSKRQYKEELKKAETSDRKPWCPGLL